MLSVTRLSVSTSSGRSILNELSFTLARGQILAIFGPSGSGKSTLLNAIAGFVGLRGRDTPGRFGAISRRWFAGRSDHLTGSGSIVIDGSDVTGAAPEARPVGLVLQRFGVYPNLTGRANIAFPLTCRGASLAETIGIVDQAAQMAGVDSAHLSQKVKTLSGGEAQRVAIAKMLAKRARVALMDEPFSHLDQLRRADLAELLRSIVGAETDGAMDAVLLVSHDWRELNLADKILLLNARSDGVPSARLFERDPATRTFDFRLAADAVPPDELETRWLRGLEVTAQIAQNA